MSRSPRLDRWVVMAGLMTMLVPDRVEARHEPSATAIEWSAPTECPDGQAMQALIDATLGDVDEAERRAVSVRGTLSAEGEGYRLILVLDEGQAGTRELHGASCEELSTTAALVIAMAIDPRLLERLEIEQPQREPPDEDQQVPVAPDEPSDEPRPSVNDPSDAEHPNEATSEDPSKDSSDVHAETPATPDAGRNRSPTSTRRPLSLMIHVDGGVGAGPLPGASGTLHAGVGLAGTLWRAELGASYWTPRSATSPSNARAGASAQLWALGVQGCSEPRWRSLSFPLCTGLLAGAIHAQGRGDLTGRRIAARWIALALEPGLAWWVTPRWGLVLRARGHVALARPELRSEPSGVIFAGAPVGGSLRAGVELRLP